MRKLLLVLISFTALPLLVACGKKADNDGWLEIVENSVNNQDSLDDLRGKTPLTLEDLDRISKNRFPVSYTYNVYEWENLIEKWEYVYSGNADQKFLLPIEKDVVNREIISSVMSYDRINTMVDVTLNNGESYSILYITDSETLEYLGASLTAPTTTTLYTFSY